MQRKMKGDFSTLRLKKQTRTSSHNEYSNSIYISVDCCGSIIILLDFTLV